MKCYKVVVGDVCNIIAPSCHNDDIPKWPKRGQVMLRH